MSYLLNALNRLTPNQRRAVVARGDTLVSAGAGAGKTGTLIARCLHYLLNTQSPGSVDRLLVVTFTESAAAEMKSRLHSALTEALKHEPSSLFLQEQSALLDLAAIGTLHGFCLRLIREHCHLLDLEPRSSILSSTESMQLKAESLKSVMDGGYEQEEESLLAVMDAFGNGSESILAELVLKTHEYMETIPDSDDWFANQKDYFSQQTARAWQELLNQVIPNWGRDWRLRLDCLKAENTNGKRCSELLKELDPASGPGAHQNTINAILNADRDGWPKGRKTVHRKPMEKLFDEASFFASLLDPASPETKGVRTAIQQDWDWSRIPVLALLEFTGRFRRTYARIKKQWGCIDFHDIEQSTLRLLNLKGREGEEVLQSIRNRFDLICVDEYQDINPAQDRILQLLASRSEPGNRFLVGDIKQSIYRFRLADPSLFQGYRDAWINPSQSATVVDLQQNFRSHPKILDLVNRVFPHLFHPKSAGFHFGPESRLDCGNPDRRIPSDTLHNEASRVELWLRIKDGETEDSEEEQLEESDKDARLIAFKCREIIERGLRIRGPAGGTDRSVKWSDIVVLHRSPKTRAASFMREFRRAGIPLKVDLGQSLDSIVVRDWINLFRLLENPLQDYPLLAVLRSPLVNMTMNELAAVRWRSPKGPYWQAVEKVIERDPAENETETVARHLRSAWSKLRSFQTRCSAWRRFSRFNSVSRCLESFPIESGYWAWMMSQPDSKSLKSAFQALMKLARSFEENHRQGLSKFLQQFDTLDSLESESTDPSADTEDAVRFMSIHKSKGLEFPIVILSGLDKKFNLEDVKSPVLLDPEMGLCPRVRPPDTPARYPSLPHWIASRKTKLESVGEEMRLLYVAMTRASDYLALTGSLTGKQLEKADLNEDQEPSSFQRIFHSNNCLDLLLPSLKAAYPQMEFSRNGSLDSDSISWSVFEELPTLNTQETSLDPQMAETRSEGEGSAEGLSKMNWTYPFLQATRLPAKSSVSSLRQNHRLQEDAHDANRWDEGNPRTNGPEPCRPDALEIGKAWHLVMQTMRIHPFPTLESVKTDIDRLLGTSGLDPNAVPDIDPSLVLGFWSSLTGKAFHEHSNLLHREMPFTCRMNPETLHAHGLLTEDPEALNGDTMLIQGVVDLAMIAPKEIWILDYKTDRLQVEGQFRMKTEQYQSQLRIYASALERIFGRPVTRGFLYFLRHERAVSVDL